MTLLSAARSREAGAGGTGTLPAAAPVLVVEDNDALREAIVYGLELAGYDVIAAEHGRAALDLLRCGPVPAVIVLDLMMPVMDGWEFRRHQLADPTLAAIPVIVLSADARSAGLAVSPGVRRVLLKPMDLDMLLEAIERAASDG